MNEEMCDELIEEYNYFVSRTNRYDSGGSLVVALQLRKLLEKR